MSEVEFDPRFWHNIQRPFEMDVLRRFEYDEDNLKLLKRWLRLHDPRIKVIVEVVIGDVKRMWVGLPKVALEKNVAIMSIIPKKDLLTILLESAKGGIE